MGMLDGKVAIVTGAGRGLGRSHAEALAAEGAAVVINDPGVAVSGEAEAGAAPADEVVSAIIAKGGKAVANYASVADWAGAESIINSAIERFGRLDILVNNAGIVRDRMSFNMLEAEWDAVIAVHLKGHAATSKFAASYWRQQAKEGKPVAGRIINTSSEAGIYGNVGQTAYGAAKAGIIGMTLVMSRELQKMGVTVNAISPRASTRFTAGVNTDGAVEEGTVEQVSPLVVYLASDQAAAITGQVFLTFAGRLKLLKGYLPVNELHKAGGFSVAEMPDAMAALFEGYSTELAPFHAEP